jgi:outer membrane protein OmpA-like peptidoglycan-associated protein
MRGPLSFTALPSVAFLLVTSGAFAQGATATPPPPAAPTPTASPAAPAPAPAPAPTPATPTPSATPTPTPTPSPPASPPAPATPSESLTASVGASTASAEPAAAASAEPGRTWANANEEREWAARDSALDESATLTGGVGLLHLQHAAGNAPGQFSLGFTTEYFSAGFLCTSSFPCAKPGGGGILTTDSLDHIGGSLTLNVGITNWLEAYAGTSAYANSDNANRPSLLQVLGDTDFGAKVYTHVSRAFAVGGAFELWLVNGTGSVGLAGSGTGAKFRGLATVDLRELEKRVPLRFSLNAQYSLDNTGAVIADTETQRGAPITRIERFGLGINRVDHFDIGIGGEALLADEKVRPFLEYNILVPINRQGYLCQPANPSGDNCLANDQLAPSKLTFGGRFFPWKRGFGVTAAFDIGITGQNDFIEEMAPIPPWTFYLGVGWGVDTWDRPPVVQTKVVEKSVETAPPLGHVKGYVHETGKPEVGVPNAIVAFTNHAELTPLATGADGHFVTLGMGEGTYDLKVTADGYKDGTCSATLTLLKPGDTLPAAKDEPEVKVTKPTVPDVAVDCALEALPRVGNVLGHVRDAQTHSAIGNVIVKLTDGSGREFTATADASGSFRFQELRPGPYALMASPAEGDKEHLTDSENIEVKPRADTSVEISLLKNPNLVQVTGKEIVIKQQVQFAFDSAVILPESTPLLTEIADVLDRNPQMHKVEIQGHTDSEGGDEHNQLLSEDRANAVKTWLTSHGVSADRLAAVGYGEKKPLVPNVTAGNRARNRRVQFIILEQDKPAPKP